MRAGYAGAGRIWRIALGVARHELAVSARTPALWVAPALWAALLLPSPATGGLPGALLNAGRASSVAGLLAAALAVTLPARTRAARAADIVEALPGAGAVAAGRTIAALVAGTVLVVSGPACATTVALLRGLPLAGSGTALALYLAVLLPAAWAATGLGLLAGSVLREVRLAALAVFLGGVGAFAAQGLPLVLTPLGAFDIGALDVGAAVAPWPVRAWLPWHVVALMGVAALAAVAAGPVGRGWRAARVLLGPAVCVLVGVAGYTWGLSGIQVGHGGAPRQWTSAWAVRRMAVTLDLGRTTTATARLVLRDAGPAPLSAVALHLPAGLRATAARLSGGVPLAPGPVLRLPRAVPPGGTAELSVTYGGRWTYFASRYPDSLVRTAGSRHLVLLAAQGAFGFLPDPEAHGAHQAPPAFPLTLRLAGTPPAASFCNLAPEAAGLWRGPSAPLQCLGADLRLARSGSAELWTGQPAAPAAAEAHALDAYAKADAACLGVADVPLGVATVPAVSTGWNTAAFDLRRFGDPARVAPVDTLELSPMSALASYDLAPLYWGPLPAPTERNSWQAYVVEQMLPASAARLAGLTPPSPTQIFTPAGLAALPGLYAVVRALPRLTPRGACALLSSLRGLAGRGRLTNAAMSAAVRQAEGGAP